MTYGLDLQDECIIWAELGLNLESDNLDWKRTTYEELCLGPSSA